MISPNEIVEEINNQLAGPLTLTVGRPIEDSIEAFHLVLDNDAADSLREHCGMTRDIIADRTPASYTAMAEIETGEQFIIDDEQTLAELGAFRTLARNLGAISQITPAQLDATIKLYAVTIGDDPSRLLFVRSNDPRLPHKSGKFFAIGQERLKRLDEPVFSFSPDFDFVLGPKWAVVLKQHSFEKLFREMGLVEQRISTWIQGITKFLPMSDSSIETLRDTALGDSRTWRRLRDIERRGHLARVTLEEVGEYASEVGLKREDVVVDGELIFDPSKRFGFLQLLNEDLYKGPLTGESFESQRKTTMG